MNTSPQPADPDVLAIPFVYYEHKGDNVPKKVKPRPWPEVRPKLLTHAERAEKDGYGLSFVENAPGATRSNDAVLRVYALTFDIDHGEPDWARLEPYEYAAFTTHSHLTINEHNPEGGPRWRITVLLARPVAGADWKGFWARAKFHLAPGADEAGKDPGRLFYAPAHAPGAPFDARHHPGRPLDPGEVPELPEELRPPPTPPPPRAGPGTGTGGRPGDDFNRRENWRALMDGWGFTWVKESGGEDYWRREGKREGQSATTNWLGLDRLKVFSTSTRFDTDRFYDKFGAYAVMAHGGNIEAAAKELAQRGYGDQKDRRAPPPVSSQGYERNEENPGESGQGGNSVISVTASPPPWERPLPLGASAVLPAFPTHALPGWLRAYVEAQAEALQIPVDVVALLVLGVLATAVAGRFEAQIRPGWREPLNLYVTPALGPGNRRSAAFEEIVAPIRRHEQGLVKQARAEGITGKGDSPPLPVLACDDVTPEKLGAMLGEQGERLAVMSAEGDIFDLMAGRYGNGTPNLGIFLKGHAGDEYRVDRLGRPPVYLRRPALTICVTPQPDVLHGLTQREGFRGRGLLARFLYALPTSLVGERAVGAAPVPEAVRREYHERVGRLLALEPAGDSAALPFAPAAEARVRRFETWIEPRLGEFGELGHLADWASKLAGAMGRISTLLYLAEHATVEGQPWEGKVDDRATERAEPVAHWAIPHAEAAFAEMGATKKDEDVAAVLRWLRRRADRVAADGLRGEAALTALVFSRRDLHRSAQRRFPSADDLGVPLGTLVSTAYLRPRPDPEREPGQPGQPPSPTYDVNPQWLAAERLIEGLPDPEKAPGAVTEMTETPDVVDIVAASTRAEKDPGWVTEMTETPERGEGGAADPNSVISVITPSPVGGAGGVAGQSPSGGISQGVWPRPAPPPAPGGDEGDEAGGGAGDDAGRAAVEAPAEPAAEASPEEPKEPKEAREWQF